MFLFKDTTNGTVTASYCEGINKDQVPGQTMNTVGAAASIGSVYTYTHSHTYKMLCYTYTVHIYYVCISINSAFVRTTK